MAMTLHLQQTVQTQAQPTDRSMDIAVMFGLSIDGQRDHTIIPPIELTLCPSQLVFVTGVSGGGKSTLLRLISQAMPVNASSPSGSTEPSVDLVWSDRLAQLPEAALVDALAYPEGPQANLQRPPATLERVCHWLSLAGLNDAAVMLRQPKQLSEGQRHRLRLAQAMAVAERSEADWTVLLIDEFGSTLDRITAAALARSVRRWISRSHVCLVAATTHDDLLEPLAPDVLIEVAPGGVCQVHHRSH